MDRLDQRRRALDLLRGHGWATVSFQLLEADFEYWFDGDDAFVAYVDTGGAWVAGGPPIAPPARLVEVTHDFVAAARAAGRRASFFACEQRFVDAVGGPALLVGEQPIWDPTEWDAALADPQASSLRYQLRRARKKGVAVREVDAAEVADPTSPLHRAVAALADAWMAGRGMAPMRFLVQLEPLSFPDERVLFVATRGDEVVGFLSAVPVYARRRLFVEDLLRAPGAPNGTIELLVDAAMRAAHARDDAGVTLGLAPLSGDVAPLLRVARRVSAPLYDFRGLHAFKARLRPRAWEPVYLCAPGGSPVVALHDGLAAFAGGSLVRFGLATLVRRPWLLAAGLLAAALLALAALWLLRW